MAGDGLDEVIEHIVEVARPERIILFGSAAKGEIGPHSDDLALVRLRVPEAYLEDICFDAQTFTDSAQWR